MADVEEFPTGSPIRVGPRPRADGPEAGTGLCLSGGGYRAMLFHLGVLWRLNEAGWLRRIDRVSSVSGGSIMAGVLAKAWADLTWQADTATNFDELCVEPIRRLADTRVDVGAVLGGGLTPFTRISDKVQRKLDKILFRGTSLKDLPTEPRFIFNTTNLESGALMRFSRPYVADYKVGEIKDPDIPLAAAVTASAAFPPFLSPFEFDGSEHVWTDLPGNSLTSPGYRDEIYLSDGGVYDNLGLETVWGRYQTVLVSDAGGLFSPDHEPPGDWVLGLLRVLNIIDSQVRALRRRITIDAFEDDADPHKGFFVSTGMRFDELPPGGPQLIDVDPEVTTRLARISTRLTAMPEDDQKLLVNWGYAAADAGLRTYVDTGQERGSLPYADHPLG